MGVGGPCRDTFYAHDWPWDPSFPSLEAQCLSFPENAGLSAADGVVGTGTCADAPAATQQRNPSIG